MTTTSIRLWRPLDPVRSIRAKLGLLVAASVIASVTATWFGLVVLGWWLRFTLPLAVLVALVVTQLLARGMTRPLRQMTAAARRMAAGDLPSAVDVSSRDEVGELARAFTAMAADLSSADAQRRELLANVAHELRTPVAAIRAQVENLVDGVRPPDSAALGEVLERVERMATLVEDLLDLARAQGGAAPFAPAVTVVAPLVVDSVDQVRHAHPGVTVEVDVDATVTAVVDPARLRQVLVNLVDNAARHGGETGRILVTVRPDGSAGAAGGVVLDVVDEGPGIAPADREAVFERFRHRGEGGSGLGLAIARWAVALHRGHIHIIDSPSGCHVRVELPAPAQEDQP